MSDSAEDFDSNLPAMDTDATKAYLKEIGKVPLLKAHQEIELAIKIESGVDAKERLTESNLTPREAVMLQKVVREGKKATDAMIEANLRLVVSIAKKFWHPGRKMTLLDLIQEGNSGLMRAVEKFDHTLGYKFSTYATWWIQQSITRAIAEQEKTIRIPVHMEEGINKMLRIRQKMIQDEGLEPSFEKLAEELDIPVFKVIDMWQIAGLEPSSLDAPIANDEDRDSRGDLIADSDTDVLGDAFKVIMKEEIDIVLNDLNTREKRIIQMRFGLMDNHPRTLEEVGRVFGITRERVRQIEAKTLNKLRYRLHDKGLKDYLHS